MIRPFTITDVQRAQIMVHELLGRQARNFETHVGDYGFTFKVLHRDRNQEITIAQASRPERDENELNAFCLEPSEVETVLRSTGWI